MSPKTTNPPAKAPASSKSPSASSARPDHLALQWEEARQTYAIYSALATQFSLAPLPYGDGELPPARPTRAIFDRHLQWMAAVDEKALAYQLRQIPPSILNASEEGLRFLVHRQLRKPHKSTADRDKIDLLLVQYFAMGANEELLHKEIMLADVAQILQPVLSEADATPLEWCEPLEEILERARNCQSLRDLMEEGLLEQGRLLKDSAGAMFYDPAALVAFCRFNFLVRRAFIRMLHADLRAVREAVDALEAKGVKTVDCRSAGFSAAETTLQLRHFCENWRQPFQKDYTQSSVTRAFEQLLAVRAELEEALKERPKAAQAAAAPAAKPKKNEAAETPAKSAAPASDKSKAAAPAATAPSEPKQAPAAAKGAEAEPKPKATSASKQGPAKQASDAPAASGQAADAEKCMEAIWEQLIAVPPSRGRSMSTVTLQDTKVLLSSWEVSAFVSEGGQEAEDLRRAVTARALLALATDQKKRSGDEGPLAFALALARDEVSYFQGRVEDAKKSKNTEAAVNLGISAKRLLSFIEEAEKLQS
jgi:flagellar motor protein MotB